MSTELPTPKLGRISLRSAYGCVDDQTKTVGVLDRLLQSVSKMGSPWALVGDCNVRAGDVAGTLKGWQAKMRKA